MASLEGGCLCGDVRYEIEGEPFRTLNCHCDDCRKATGSAFTTIVFYKDEQISVSKGRPNSFEHRADSGNKVHKYFCGNCGSPLFGTTELRPGTTYVRLGSMDDGNFAQPELNLYASRVLKSTVVDETLASFDTMPSST